MANDTCPSGASSNCSTAAATSTSATTKITSSSLTTGIYTRISTSQNVFVHMHALLTMQ